MNRDLNVFSLEYEAQKGISIDQFIKIFTEKESESHFGSSLFLLRDIKASYQRRLDNKHEFPFSSSDNPQGAGR